MIENYQGTKFESKGIDLNQYNKQELIDRFSNNIKVNGINVLLLLYKGLVTEKTKGGILLPPSLQDRELEYNSYTGLVIQLGSDAFAGKNFPSGPYIKVGDWVVFPRSSCLQLKYEDEPFVIIEDFKIKMTIDDPSKISR